MAKDAAIPAYIRHLDTQEEYRLGSFEIDELDELTKVIRTHGIYCDMDGTSFSEAGEIRTQFVWNAGNLNAIRFEILLDEQPF